MLLLDVYAASEQPIDGADSKSLCRSIRLRGQVEPIYVGEPDSLADILASVMQENDVIMTQGAGNIGQIARKLANSELEPKKFQREWQ